jgi:hypothetical protein
VHWRNSPPYAQHPASKESINWVFAHFFILSISILGNSFLFLVQKTSV